jgi:DNA-binding response OmpR family regulator
MLDEVKIDLTLKNLIYSISMSNPGISYSRETLLNLVWGYEFSGYEHTVNSI